MEHTHIILLRGAMPTGKNKVPMARLRELYALRDPLYRETAHFVAETGRPSVSTLVNMVVMQLELAGVLPLAAQAPVAP